MGIFTSKLSGGIFVLLVATTIAAVAAWFSITGLVALFNASALSVAIMGIALEVGKLVASGILKLNWSNPNYNRALKGYLLVAIATLMMVTALGIFGFLSAAHLEQSAPRADLQVQSQQLELQVEQRNQETQRLQQRLTQIDQNISVFLKNDQASRGLRASRTLQTERTSIQQRLESNNEQINALQERLAPLRMKSNAVETKLGPVKYVAALFGWNDEESAVRLVILILMVGFDPLAVVLILCGIIMLKEHRDEKNTSDIHNGAELVDLPPSPKTDVEESIRQDMHEPNGWAVEPDHKPIKYDEYVFPSSAIGRSTVVTEPPKGDFIDDDDLKYWQDRMSNALPVPEASPRVTKAALEIEDATIVDEPDVEDRSDYDRSAMENEFAGDEKPVEESPSLIEVEDVQGLIDVPEAVGDEEPTEQIVREMDRDTLISILERNPGILNEIEEIVEADVAQELTDREKLLDLLAKNPAIISDMAEIIASQITMRNDGNSWLK